MRHHVDRHTYDQVMVPAFSPADIIPCRAAGSRVWDQQGREYIDFAAADGSACVGHCNPDLLQTLTDQARRLWHPGNDWSNEPALKLAQQLCAATFAEKVFFASSGAEAVEAALNLARRHSLQRGHRDKQVIVTFNRASHGHTLMTSAAADPAAETSPLSGLFRQCRYNDLDALAAVLDDHCCAVLLEPIQAEGGVFPADPAFVRGARELCDKHKALLIFDETQTGNGRCCALFAYMKLGVVPDILTTGNGLGGGFPIAAMLCHSEVASSQSRGTQGSTFGGNPLACSIAARVLEQVSDPQLLQDVKQRYFWFREGLEAINRRFGLFLDIRGRGLLLGCVLKQEWHGRAGEIRRQAMTQGLLILTAGDDVIRFSPSLLIPREEIELGLSCLEEALAQLTAS
ncbi:aminotransferase class III-fold pyridoxal phosphate-dependent enzyme [Marinobacterium jannaschii]|uniref:aminotransferase class III-fold pyridoxal phosphate-dependent enzyme n=1 Tax=Marinobacterium jannaschii TaxID=64970 RepID=UPI0004887334|nr:aminotransferase class III-fold pyridoxal phosphate-dependent enzyme [Marinobacterium jannaschii]